MPELPEVETIVRGLRGSLLGDGIVRVLVYKADILRQDGAKFRSMVRGRSISEVERRGKNIVVSLAGDAVLLFNLGMTGRLLWFARPPRGTARPSHVTIRFALGSGGVLFFDDVRRFGSAEALPAEAWRLRSRSLGPEPLDLSFTPQGLHKACMRSRSPIRSWLLDQRRIAGVGNIYANEALFQAGIDPLRPARTLSIEEAADLHRGLRGVLERAIKARGTTLRNYRDASGSQGSFGTQLAVYGIRDDPCRSCSTPIERIVLSNRSAFRCPDCQS